MKLNFFKSNKKSHQESIKCKNRKLRRPFNIALFILVPILIIAAVYYTLDRVGYIRAFQLGLEVQQQEQMQSEDKAALESLKKILLLPGDEVEPTTAIISDAEALKAEQPDFFANAKNGDRIIIYPTIAIIYDYKANQIIKVGPVQFQQPAEGEAIEAVDESSAEIQQ